MAGYSSSPLTKKLGIADGHVVLLVDPPVDLHLALPPQSTVKRQLRGRVDVALVFVTHLSQLGRRFERLAASVFPSGAIWIAWPKRSSGVETDVTDHAARQLAIDHGLVDNKVCAIDDTWTALRVVWRVENRT
jgi:hypothetical protein